MTEQTNKHWYIERRGQLLAEQFLLELEPHSLSPVQNLDVGIDFMAFFLKADGSLVTIGVVVKAVQQSNEGRYSFASSQAQQLLNTNIPVLLLMIDVKDNDIYFDWIQNAVSPEKRASLNKTTSCSVYLRKTSVEEIARLKQEIVQDEARVAMSAK